MFSSDLGTVILNIICFFPPDKAPANWGLRGSPYVILYVSPFLYYKLEEST